MKIKISDLKLDENRVYTATIEDVKFGSGNYGDYVVFQLSTDYGNVNYMVGLTARGKLIRMLYAAGYNVNEMNSSDEIDLNELVGKTIGVKLGYSSEGYLRVQGILPIENTEETTEYLETSPDDIFA